MVSQRDHYGKKLLGDKVLTHLILRNLTVLVETDVEGSFSFNSKNKRFWLNFLNKTEQNGLKAQVLVEQQVRCGG